METQEVFPTRSSSKAAYGLLNKLAQYLVVPTLVVLGWWTLSATGWFPAAMFPDPWRVVRALADWVIGYEQARYSGTWLASARDSAIRVLLGYLIGSGLGIVVGGLLGYFTPLRRMVEPFMHMLRAVPILAWLPLALVFFGFSLGSALFLVALGVFFPVAINTMSGVQGVDTSHVQVGRMVGASRREMLRFIIMPSAMPSVVTGLRVGIGFAWILVIAAEWMAVRTGLGYTLMDAYRYVRYDFVIAAMISVGFVGFMSDQVLARLTRPLIRWHIDTTAGER